MNFCLDYVEWELKIEAVWVLKLMDILTDRTEMEKECLLWGNYNYKEILGSSKMVFSGHLVLVF